MQSEVDYKLYHKLKEIKKINQRKKDTNKKNLFSLIQSFLFEPFIAQREKNKSENLENLKKKGGKNGGKETIPEHSYPDLSKPQINLCEKIHHVGFSKFTFFIL